MARCKHTEHVRLTELATASTAHEYKNGDIRHNSDYGNYTGVIREGVYTMSKHTPGPWSTVNHSWQNTSVYADGEDQLVCTLSLYEEDVTEENQDDLEAQQEADARLIAAAPDLLEACLEVLRDVERSAQNNVVWPTTVKQIQAAIEKAGAE